MKIPLFKTYSDEADVEAVTKIIRRGTYWAVGPEIQEFENKLAKYIGKKYALTFNSGTSALHTLLLAHNIAGKEVIVPSFTFIATANAVILAGGKPVFADIEQETYGLEYESVKNKITENTVAIMPIHYGGFPARDILKLKQLAKENNILLIEDAAQSIGAEIEGTKIGNIGDASIFSLCQNKILPTGEGGILFTDSEEIYEKSKLLRSHGRVEESKDYFSYIGDNDYVQVGFNFRMPTIIAALGISQFAKIDKIISMRRAIAKKYDLRLSKIKGIQLRTMLKNHFQVYQMYSFKLNSNKIRDRLQKHLELDGIMSKVYFYPVHQKTIYLSNNKEKKDLPNTIELSEKTLNIPLYPHMKEEEIDFVLTSIEKFFQNEEAQ